MVVDFGGFVCYFRVDYPSPVVDAASTGVIGEESRSFRSTWWGFWQSGAIFRGFSWGFCARFSNPFPADYAV
jgi:hypothetical protein